MKQEDKELLLKDLCARLPYGVKVDIPRDYLHPQTMERINKDCGIIINGMFEYDVFEYQPYLRPMSSMTDKEKEEFENLLEGIVDGIERWDKPDLCEEYDWLNAHHFDYRGLIEKGLALEAPKDMYWNLNR